MIKILASNSTIFEWNMADFFYSFILLQILSTSTYLTCPWSFVTTTILGVSFQSFKVFLLNFFHISELNFVRFSQTNHEKRSSTRIPSQKRAIPHKSSDHTHEMAAKFLQNSPESIIFNLKNFKSLSHCCHLSVLLFSEYWRVKPNCYIFLLNSSTNLTISVKKFLSLVIWFEC